MAATPAWLAAAEAMLNRGIGASARGAVLANRLEGTAVQVDVDGLASIRAAVHRGRLSLVTGSPPRVETLGVETPGVDATGVDTAAGEPADATLAGSPLALFNLARSRGTGPARGAETQVQVRGDAEIANGYRELFALARPDLEEELSRVVGDLPARRLARLAHGAADWLRKSRRTAGENLAEYLQEESRDLVNRSELEEFLRGVDDVREAADRVEARLARLEQRLTGA